MVSRISPTATGKLKKYEPLEAREFADFTNFSSLTLKNVKQTCEDYYKQQIGSAMSCIEIEGHLVSNCWQKSFLESNNYTRADISNQRIVR